MRFWWSKPEAPEPQVERQREPCILEEGVGLNVPTTSYIKKRMPLLVIEPTHYHVMRDGEPSTWMHFRSDGLTNFNSLPVGVYTVEPYMELDEFTREAEPEGDTEAVSG